METLTINVNTIHGNFDFKITPIQFGNSIKISSDCLLDTYRFEKYYDLDNDCCQIDIYHNETGQFLFVGDFDFDFDFDIDSLSIYDLEKFTEIVNKIILEYN
jgi:hypothetical protein